jgi:hypothetical protein
MESYSLPSSGLSAVLIAVDGSFVVASPPVRLMRKTVRLIEILTRRGTHDVPERDR